MRLARPALPSQRFVGKHGMDGLCAHLAAGVDLRVRPETLGVADFVAIANVLAEAVDA